MEQLTAKVLNNQIISMRKEVRKAVVHQIHGLTQKANKLRLKKGTEEQIEKNNLKADYFVSEIQVLKKLKPDNVSLFALSNPSDSDLKRLVSKPVISAEAKAMAKLCLRENMQKAVREFISAHNGSIELLNDLLSERCNKSGKQKKKKKMKKKKKELEGNAQKPEKKKVAKNEIPDDMSESSDSIPQLVPIPDKPEVLISDEDESDLENESGNASNASDMSDQDDDDEVGDNPENEDSDDDDDDDNTDDYIQEKKAHQIVSKDSLQIKSHSANKSNSTDKQGQIKVSNQTVKRKRVDPFFKTSDDSDYFTFCDIGDNAELNSNNNHFKPEKNEKGFFKRTTEFINKNPFKKADKNVYQKNNDRSSFKRDFYDKTSFKKGFRGNRGGHNYKSQLNHDVPNNRRQNFKGNEQKQRYNTKELAGKLDENVKLHPSWEAKKKLNIASLPFEGKKIIFDDD